MFTTRDFYVAASAATLMFLLSCAFTVWLVCGNLECLTDIKAYYVNANQTYMSLNLDEWMAALPHGAAITNGKYPRELYYFLFVCCLSLLWMIRSVMNSIRVTTLAVYYYILDDELPQPYRGTTLVCSYILCYDALSNEEKDWFGMLIIDGWFTGHASRIIHFVVTAVYLTVTNFPSDGVMVNVYLAVQTMVSVFYYITLLAIFAQRYSTPIQLYWSSNIWSYPSVWYFVFTHDPWYHIDSMLAVLLTSFTAGIISTFIRRRMDKIVFDLKPDAKLVERDSNNLKVAFGYIVDQAFKVAQSSSKGDFVAEAAMPGSEFHNSTCPKWQIFFTADSTVIGSGFVTKRGIVTALHVYVVLSSEAKAGKEIRVVGPRGAAKFPAHKLSLSVEVTETIIISVAPALYSVIGAKAISNDNIKPSTPGPVFIYGHKGGVMKRTMGAILSESDTSIVNFEHNCSTLAGWSGSPLMRGNQIIGMHRGSDGKCNISEDVYVGLGFHKAMFKTLKKKYDESKAESQTNNTIVLESFSDASSTPAMREAKRQLTMEQRAELRAARMDEIEEQGRSIADEVVRKARIYRATIEYDDDLADLDEGMLMNIFADLQAFGTLTEEQEQYLGVRSTSLARVRGKKHGKVVTSESDNATVASVLVPKVVKPESDQEPPSDFPLGQEGSTVKTQSTSPTVSASQPTQVSSSTQTSEPSSQSNPKSQRRSRTRSKSRKGNITPQVVLQAPAAMQEFPTTATIQAGTTKLTRKAEKALRSSIKALASQLAEAQLQLASGTNPVNASQTGSSPPQPLSQVSQTTSTPPQAQQQKNGA